MLNLSGIKSLMIMSKKDKMQRKIAEYSKQGGAIVYSAEEPNLEVGSYAKIINEKKMDRFT